MLPYYTKLINALPLRHITLSYYATAIPTMPCWYMTKPNWLRTTSTLLHNTLQYNCTTIQDITRLHRTLQVHCILLLHKTIPYSTIPNITLPIQYSTTPDHTLLCRYDTKPHCTITTLDSTLPNKYMTWLYSTITKRHIASQYFTHTISRLIIKSSYPTLKHRTAHYQNNYWTIPYITSPTLENAMH